jgi:hypothetical protein
MEERKLVDCIKKDMLAVFDDIIDTYDIDTKKDMIAAVSAIQAVVIKKYIDNMGEKETAMFFYSIADKIVGDMVDRNLKKRK